MGEKRTRKNETHPIIVKTIALRASYNLAPTPSFKGRTVLGHGGVIYCTSSIYRDIPGREAPWGAETMLPRMQVPGVQILHGSLVKKSKNSPAKWFQLEKVHSGKRGTMKWQGKVLMRIPLKIQTTFASYRNYSRSSYFFALCTYKPKKTEILFYSIL